MTIQEEGWQNRMWHFYDNLGCVHYGVQFKRNAASKVAYFAAEKTDDNEEEPQPTTNTAVIDAVARLKSRFGDINEIVAEFMVHINVPGEGYLVGQDGLEGEEWDVWSVEEIRQSQFAALLDLQPDRAIADTGDYAARIWRPHPRNRHLADAPLRPVADQCEQLLLLEDSISASAKSRLNAGLMLLPSELSIDDMDAFEDEVIAVLTTGIKETEAASRWAPGFIRGPAEFLDSIRVLSFARDMDPAFAAMREELTRSIAAGIDLPAEIILGKADLNHWTGWEIDESAFRDHIDPDIVLILDSITRGYLHPALVEGGMGQEEAERFLIWRDLSDLGQKPVTVPEAIELNAAGIISDTYVRDLIGATDEDAPEEVEEPEPPPPLTAVPMPTPPGPPQQADQVIVAAVPRLRPLTELSSIDRTLLTRITEASEAGLNRVLERAGAKIRSHAKKDRAIEASINRIPNDQVTLHLGEALTRQLQITPQDLVPDDSFDPLQKRLRTIMAGAEEEVAVQLEAITGERPEPQPEKVQAAIAGFLSTLAGFALGMLFKPQEPGPGEVGDSIIPPNMVVDMMTQAGGAIPTAGPSDVRGFATGADSTEWLEGHGVKVAAHQWEYGNDATRKRPFPPHRRLDGVTFDDWDDEQLDTPASASFLNVSHMFPGDHFRCQCMTVPVIVAPSSSGPGSGIRPDELTPGGPELSWEQFGVKMPTDPTRRHLMQQALQRLNGLDPLVRERYLQLMGQFDGGIKFNVATASTKAIAELGRVTQLTGRGGVFLPNGRKLSLQLSRQTDDWDDWVTLHNAEHRARAREVRPAGGPSHSELMDQWRAANPEPTRWRLATPDELADTLIHELGHANDFQQALDINRTMVARLDSDTKDLVWEMYWGGTKADIRTPGWSVKPQAAYEYATSSSVEMVAELQRFYLRGVYGDGIALTAEAWRSANPVLAEWVRSNLLP